MTLLSNLHYYYIYIYIYICTLMYFIFYFGCILFWMCSVRVNAALDSQRLQRDL